MQMAIVRGGHTVIHGIQKEEKERKKAFSYFQFIFIFPFLNTHSTHPGPA
jgi:hypothetical protein